MIKIVGIRILKSGKNKYELTFIKNGKKITRKFGVRGKTNYTINKNKRQRDIYLHKNKLSVRSKDPTKTAFLNMFILWNKPTIRGGMEDYKRRVKIYNRTGRFPINIPGYKRMSSNKRSKYGMLTSLREKLYNIGDRYGSKRLKDLGVDPDIRRFEEQMEEYHRDAGATKIQKSGRAYLAREKLKKLKNRGLELRNAAARKIQKAWYPKTFQMVQNPEGEEMINLFGNKLPKNVVNKKLYQSIKTKLKKSIKGRRWGAYDSGRLVKMYKAAGGKYKGQKGKTNLGRWYSEKWVDACAWPRRKPCGRNTKSSIAYCRPSKRVDSKTPKLIQTLSRSQIKSRCARKKRNPKKRIYN